MPTEIVSIPKALIYEEDEGKPIYYRGYKKVLSGELNIESVMGSSLIQSRIVMAIIRFLIRNLDENLYEILSSEVGIHLGKGKNRACDIVVYEKEILKAVTETNQYLSIPPKIIFEVDIQADLENTTAQGYVNMKTQQLLDWGVEKVVWIETESHKIMIATPNAPWIIINWSDEFEIMDDLHLNLTQLLANS